ncbi:alpha,alpha-trehalose-phosphate synthase (UDP-forming) [Nocardiopsis kunsanensis]|uniref:Trehalose-6-phosphate synthase n=1 Tax=Nocardiopsis kunsanensis TaxID=141693 RepID=A0A918XJD9_9ACTN|nr:trehalose-6-phosphate synthase [Nocardiopsis kunsanensis]GHD34933.1 trehalose-6-phosphate synthase [Nocardiopsis kunsanensis]
MDKAQTLIAANRGPISFRTAEDGSLEYSRGGGGLVSGMTSVAAEVDSLWVCAALSDDDRRAAAEAPGARIDRVHDLGGMRVHMLDIPERTFAGAYTGIANSTLWFLQHLLYDLPNKPVFGSGFARLWEDYAAYNNAFAEALVSGAAEGARVAVQDYHLALVPQILRSRRPDLRITHFSHTPWAPPEYLRMLPNRVARELLEGMLGADRLGFHSPRWAEAFLRCCSEILGADVDIDRRTVEHGGRVVTVGVHALGADEEGLRTSAAEPEVAQRRGALSQLVGDTRLIVRVDRTELSKNIVRGLESYRELLTLHPEWRGRVTHLAFAYPSRGDVPEYREYTETVLRMAEEINEEFSTPEWTPLVLEVNDDYPRSLASFQLADVLLVNPVRDGMNLVAKEGPLLSERDSVLVLSREAGAADELGEDALLVNPFDTVETAEALHQALSMPDRERRERRERLAEAAVALPPRRWFQEQIRSLG